MTYVPRPGLDVPWVLDHIGWGYGYVRQRTGLGSLAVVCIVENLGQENSRLHLDVRR